MATGRACEPGVAERRQGLGAGRSREGCEEPMRTMNRYLYRSEDRDFRLEVADPEPQEADLCPRCGEPCYQKNVCTSCGCSVCGVAHEGDRAKCEVCRHAVPDEEGL